MRSAQKKGVTIHRWPVEMLKAFESAWLEVIDKEAAQHADVKKVWVSLREFREQYPLWGEAGYLR